MGASDEVDLSGAALERPAGGMQQVAQHKGGPGAQGMKPLTEAERVQSSQQVPRPYAVPHAPQSSIPGLPNMFIQMPTYNGVETGGKPPPAVRLAHTSAVQQGLAEAGTFAKCRRSFLTWMAGTPMSQLSEQGTDLEQMNSIERRLLRYADDAAYCLDLLSILGFSWFSGERAKPISKSTWH
eukprot:gene22479-29602_t